MRLSKTKQFFITLAAFLVLGISFKVMVLVEGLTEVRPVNAIPPVAGLICGPVGAFACAAGNLLADLAGTLSETSVLGIVGNFVAAYLPYRLWHLFRRESPNLHSGTNIFCYILISLSAAMTVAWILAFGLYAFWGIWMEEIYTYVFFNNLGFSVGLGMPILIILTSEGIQVGCRKAPKKARLLQKPVCRNIVCGGYFCLMLSLAAAVLAGHKNPADAVWMMPVCAAAFVGLVCQII